jgi:Rad3-related DNA helicase
MSMIEINKFQEQAPEFLYEKLVKGRNVLVDAPPGLGKSYAACKCAARLATTGKRVLIIVPTRTLRRQNFDNILKEVENIDVHESKGINDYYCPLIMANADPTVCQNERDMCKRENKGCDVLKDVESCETAAVTVATFSKFLLNKQQFKGNEIIFIDESHGFENAETTFLQAYLSFKKMREVASKLEGIKPSVQEKISRLARSLELISLRVGGSNLLAPQEVIRIRGFLEDEEFRTFALECSKENKHLFFRYFYLQLNSMKMKMQNISRNQFFFYKDTLIGRPKSMRAELASSFNYKSIALLSATIDEPFEHAKACAVDTRRFDKERDAAIIKDYPRIRRSNRLLISLTDGPNLKTGNAQYPLNRERANRILKEILEEFMVKTLLLFRSYEDHDLAETYFRKCTFSERIIKIERGEDPDTIEEKISEFRGRNIILTTASTRLWEGADIPGLRLLIIDALPYPSPDPILKNYFPRGPRIMIKKLKQGLGRIVRNDRDWGAAVVIDNRFSCEFGSISKKLPWYMGEDFKRMSLPEAIEELRGFISAREGRTLV